jgi:hypothetical protein
MPNNYDVDRYKDVEGYIVTCFECGTEFEAVRDDSVFCSPKCRTRNHRKKGQLDKDIAKAKDLIASLVKRMPSSGESKTFVALNEISATIERALAYIEGN